MIFIEPINKNQRQNLAQVFKFRLYFAGYSCYRTYMDNPRICVVTYDRFGNSSLSSIPIFTQYPVDIRCACSYQRFYADLSLKKVNLKLIYINENLKQTPYYVDITSACKNNSYIYLFVLNHDGLYTLHVYCDYAHNGTFELPTMKSQ